MSIAPIILLMHNREPSKCPGCGKPEDIKQVCRHCGREYCEEESCGCLTPILAILIIGAIVWFLFTIGHWLMSQQFDKLTLLEVLKSQAHFIGGLRLW